MVMAEEQLAAAATFLSPVLGRGTPLYRKRAKSKVNCRIAPGGPNGACSIIDSICGGIAVPSDGDTARKTVIRRALALWLDIHHALLSDPDTSSASKMMYSSSSRRVVDGLLDLISLEGIYPCLSPGVGIPIERRVRSVLQGGVVPQPVTEAQGDEELLTAIVNDLYPVVKDGGNGLGLALRERTLVDVIAGAGQLAFDPSEAAQQRQKRFAIVFKVLLEQYVTFLELQCRMIVLQSIQKTVNIMPLLC